MLEMNPMRAAIALALANLGVVRKHRPATMYGPGRKSHKIVEQNGHFGGVGDTRLGMPKPLNAGPHWADFLVGRQLHRQLARLMLKQERSQAKLKARQDAHLAMLSRRRQRDVAYGKMLADLGVPNHLRPTSRRLTFKQARKLGTKRYEQFAG